MLFNDPRFLIFLAALIVLMLITKTRFAKKVLLLTFSYLFYGYWDYRFLALIFLSTAVDYFAAILINRSSRIVTRRLFLLCSIFMNIGILSYFKYYNFFINSLSSTLHPFGINISFTTANIILPVGISFYTFQTLSYTIDVFKRRIKPTYNIIDFSLFVAFFPQLIAGPIERASRLIPQIKSFDGIKLSNLKRAFQLMFSGYVKKVLIADSVAILSESVFSSSNSQSSIDLTIGATAFVLQVYFDFSGYSDIARGIAKIFNIDLIVNFRQPFFASSFSNFWNRWHISLSHWFRDYVFLPLTPRRSSKFRIYFNILFTMSLCGLWHGASWNYLLWGTIHGIYLSTQRILERVIPLNFSRRIPSYIKSIMIFVLVLFSFIFGRAASISEGLKGIKQILFWTGSISLSQSSILMLLVLSLITMDIFLYSPHKKYYLFNLKPWIYIPTAVITTVFILIKMILASHNVQPFYYFQF